MDFNVYSICSRFVVEINVGYLVWFNGQCLSDNLYLVWIECEIEDGVNCWVGVLSEKV